MIVFFVPVGSNGSQGLMGNPGPQGMQGRQGIQGMTGGKGIQGIMGMLGLQGLQGLRGLEGEQGVAEAHALSAHTDVSDTVTTQALDGDVLTRMGGASAGSEWANHRPPRIGSSWLVERVIGLRQPANPGIMQISAAVLNTGDLAVEFGFWQDDDRGINVESSLLLPLFQVGTVFCLQPASGTPDRLVTAKITGVGLVQNYLTDLLGALYVYTCDIIAGSTTIAVGERLFVTILQILPP
jgi:hypothetical protein